MADLTGDARRLARQSDDRLLDEDSEREERRKTFAKSRKQTLPVKDIEVPNDYRPLDYEKFKKLLPDFETNGIKDRIEVHARGSRYILLHGRLRLEAAKRLRLDEIRAVIFSDYRPKAEPRKKAPSKPLPKEWVLVGRARAGDIEARNVLIEHYYRVATFVGAKGARGWNSAPQTALPSTPLLLPSIRGTQARVRSVHGSAPRLNTRLLTLGARSDGSMPSRRACITV